MKKSFLTSLCALCTLFFVPISVCAIDQVTIGGDQIPITSYSLPISINATSEIATGAYYAISQQIYLASELGSGTAKKISAVKFQYVGASNLSRDLEVYLMETNLSAFPSTSFIANANDEAGDKVYDGAVTLTASSDVTIEFTQDFEWNGSKNIVLTIYDKTGRKDYPRNGFNIFATPAEGGNRFGFKRCNAAVMNAFNGWSMDAVSSISADSQSNYKYANIITFIFAEEDPEPPATPTNLSVSATTTTSASLSWLSSFGATSYDLQQSANGEDWSSLATGLTGTSYNWTGLSAASTQYARIRAHNDAGYSDWSDAVTVTTDAVHEHDGFTFSKWTSTNSLPTSGNYYLANNVAFGIMNDDVTLDGNLNLCLNGKIADVYGSRIIVPSGKTLTIYDNVGGGKITGVVASEVGLFEDQVKSLIVVKSGGSLVLKQGTIENAYIPDADGSSYAIYSNGTVHISGNVLINSNDIDIYLHESRIITLDAAISNEEKHTVYITGGTFTSGWSTYMSAANPRDYFESANSGKSVCLSEGEAAMRLLLHLSEESQNSGISTSYGQVADVELTRSLTSAQYNTFCLPFALDDEQLQAFFGSGYDLEALISSSLEDEILTLTFERKYELKAGKPYLLQPTSNVTELSFIGVTITANAPVNVTTEYADFKPVYATTNLEDGNSNILFLGENNTLFWPESSTGNMKAFRAYFELKNVPANVQARIGRAESQTTAIDNQKSHIDNHKYMKDGQLLIERNGVIYNAQGQTIK